MARQGQAFRAQRACAKSAADVTGSLGARFFLCGQKVFLVSQASYENRIDSVRPAPTLSPSGSPAGVQNARIFCRKEFDPDATSTKHQKSGIRRFRLVERVLPAGMIQIGWRRSSLLRGVLRASKTLRILSNGVRLLHRR